ncbi:MAG: HD domain-containing protein [Armatimonadetes bacterium]|nr:HD domain-containing protein [Armatimonadota bacterium]
MIAAMEGFKQQRGDLFADLRANPSGEKWCKGHTALADAAVQGIYDDIIAGAPVAVVAVGGYGRQEVAPRSDLDLTFIPLDEHDPKNDEAVRALFKRIIDAFEALEWPVSYAYRLISDAPALDDKTRTGLLDARLVAGEQDALDRFLESYWASFPTAEFLISKFKERADRRRRWHDTPRVVEFHLQEGAGGLREIQCAQWFDVALGLGLQADTSVARETLLQVRNVLHLVTGRKEDRLLRTRSSEVANVLNADPNDVRELVMAAGEEIAREWDRAVYHACRATFQLSAGVRAKDGKCFFRAEASLAEAAVGVCRATELGLRVERAAISPDLGDAALITDCLAAGISALRSLDRAGLLDALLPEFAASKHLLPRDSVHEFSVGEHSIRVVGALDLMRADKEFDAAWGDVANQRPLYLAALAHDLGKVDPDKPHSEVGANLADAICSRLRMGDAERLTTVWLVRHHLTLAQIARTHDLGQPGAALELARLCERQDRLAMLYLLTVADVSSVAEGVWSPQMASAINELYAQTKTAIGLEVTPADPAVYRSAAIRRVQSASIGKDTEALIESMPTHYLLATPKESLPLHADYLSRARSGGTVVEFHNNLESRTTDITVCRLDLPEPGLLSRILGVVYAFDVALHGLRAASTTHGEPIALDVLATSFQREALPASLSSFVAAAMRECLGEPGKLDELLREHGKDPDQRQEMLTHRFFEGDLGILEVETPPGRGMPFRVTKTLAELGWNVHVARIGQWGGRAVGRFYLDLPGGVLTSGMVDSALAGGGP